MAQAAVAFLQNQYVERDGREQPFFAGWLRHLRPRQRCRLGQALQRTPEFRYYQSRNEQAQVHIAIGYAKMKNRLQTFACTSSIGPGATNMLTGAATATINRLPVLLLPGDIFARRNVRRSSSSSSPSSSQDVSVNDSFKPLSRYWDRINRPDQLLTALPEAMRVLTSPAETGAVTLACRRTCRPRRTTIRRRSSTSGSGACRAIGRTVSALRRGGAADPRQRSAADRRRRRRDLQRGDRSAAPIRGAHRHSGCRDDGRAREVCRSTTRSASAPSARRARWPRTGSPARPISSSASARATPISRPPPRPHFSTQMSASSTST